MGKVSSLGTDPRYVKPEREYYVIPMSGGKF